MANATSFTPPSPGLSVQLSATQFLRLGSPKGPENIKITILIGVKGAGREVDDNYISFSIFRQAHLVT